MTKPYDLIVIGGGPAGHAVAESATGYGAKVCIIEKNGWGGTCTHRGCIPTKALLACSKRLVDMKKLKRLGISIGDKTFDFAAMKRHQVQMTRISALGVEQSLKKAGVDMINGEGILSAPGEVQWKTPAGDIQTLSTRYTCITWGSEPAVLPHIQTSNRVLTSDGFLNLDYLPKTVVIIGGSVIGVEFATLLAELGVHVTLMEILDTLLPLEDEDAVQLVKQELSLLGIVMHTATTVKEIVEKPDAVQIRAEKTTGLLEEAAEYVLLCTGRNPLLFPEQLQNIGIRYDHRGIHTNLHGETNISGIYAIGDVSGGMMLAHRAAQQGKALASYLFGDGSIVCRDETIPSVVYSHPPIARVGLTEQQARVMGLEIDVIKTDYGAGITARTELAGQGFAKLLFHEDQLVGATIIGMEASELIASLGLAMTGKLDKKTLVNWVIPHPTLSEILHI